MKRVLLVIAALLSLTVLLAACKKSGDTISTSTAESTPATVEATPAPTELPPYEANVLTGEPKGADYPEGQRITAVMINNIVAARPQRGLSKADILFEIKVEGGITRFMPVFTDYKTVGEVGPEQQRRCQRLPRLWPRQLGRPELQRRYSEAGAHDVHQRRQHRKLYQQPECGYEPPLQLHLL